jgi:hypothetical protein
MQHDPAAFLCAMWDNAGSDTRHHLLYAAALAAVRPAFPDAESDGAGGICLLSDEADPNARCAVLVRYHIRRGSVEVRHPGLMAHPDRHADAYLGRATINLIGGDLTGLADALVAMLDGLQAPGGAE